MENNLVKFKSAVSLAVLVVILFSAFVFNVGSTRAVALQDDIVGQLGQAGTGADYAPSDYKDPRQIVANIIRVALELLGMIFFALTLYAGFTWMTAGGNEEKVTQAKSLLTQAVIGLAIILAAYSITAFAIKLAKGDYTDYWSGELRRERYEKAPIYDQDASGVQTREGNIF